MPGPEDDDPLPEWLTAPLTEVELPRTAPHRSLDWLAGRREGFHVAVEKIIRSFLVHAARAGSNPKAAIEVAGRIRAAAREKSG